MDFKKKLKKYFNKKKLKKLSKKRSFRVAICSLVLASMGIGYFSTGAKAAVTITNKGQGMAYVSINGKNVYTFYKYLNDESKAIAYCLEHDKPQPSGQTFTESTDSTKAGLDSTKMNRAFTVLKYGHGSDTAIPEIRGLSTVDEKYYATQLAVWDIIGQISMRDLQWKSGTDAVRNAYMALRDKAYNNTEYTGGNMSISPATGSVTKYGDGYISPEYQVTSSGTIVNSRIGWSVTPAVSGSDGIKVIDESGNELDRTNLKIGQKFKLIIPKKLEGHTIKIDASGDVNLKTILFYYTDANVQNVASYKTIQTDDIVKKAATLTIPTEDTPVTPPTPPVEDKPMGRIKINKVDVDTGEKLQGAVFQVREKDTDIVVVDRITTNTNGEATTGLIPLGNYLVKELNYPTNYVPNDKDYEVKLQRENEIVEVTVDNRIIKGKVEVKKSDSEIHDLFLKGATFAIYDESGAEVDRFTTDQNGYGISQDLRLGKYTMKEVISPTGYLTNHATYDINITRDGDLKTFKVENDIMKGNIQIVKVDTEHEEKPVQGAVFGVFRKSDNTLLEKVTTDRNGFAYTSNLRYGDYYLKELETPDGFWQSDKKYYINIREEGKTYIRYISNKPVEAKVKLVKFDSDTREPLAGVKFKIWDKVNNEYFVFKYQENGQVVKRTVIETNGDGIAITPTILPDGDYRLEEVEVPEGYNPIKPIDFQINENVNLEDINTVGLVHTIEVPNDRIYGNVELTKDGELEKLRGAKFGLFDQTGKKVSEHTTDGEGKIRVDHLTYGRHYFQEIEAPQGYVLDSKKIEFDITDQGALVKVNALNVKIRGKIKIIKVDETGKQGLEGAEFVVKDNNGDIVDTVVTGEGGAALTRELVYGNYSIEETKAPEGHLLSNTTYTTSIKEDNSIVELVADNSKVRGKIEVYKISSDGKTPLEGAIFEIYNSKGQAVTTIETGRDGIALSRNLEYGDYTIREIKAPQGYVLGNGVYPLKITTQDQVVKVSVTNDKIKGKIKIIKVAEDGKTGLDGAVFEIMNEKGNMVDTVTTSRGGIAVSKDLEYGNYYVKEIKAPEGHIISGKIYTTAIKKDSEIVEIVADNSKVRGQIQVLKTAEDKKTPLEGAVFEITDVVGKVVEKIETGRDGIATSGNLEYGDYKIREIKAPVGYVVGNGVYPLSIKEHEEVVKLSVANDKIKGKIKITKVAEDGKTGLDGAVFEIMNKNGNMVDTVTTSLGGIAVSRDLEYGNYYVKEVKAPEGHIISGKIYTTAIKKDNEIVEIVADNSKARGQIQVFKTAEDKKTPLEGAVFEITDAIGKVVGKMETGRDGIATSGNLEYGEYKIREIKAPVGYVVGNGVYPLSIKEHEEVVKLSVTNDKIKGKIKIIKVAEDGKTGLEGAVFNIVNQDDKVVDTITTGTGGIAVSKDLEYGNYYIKEIKAPEGHLISKATYTTAIKEDQQIVEVVANNSKVRGQIQVLKTAEDEKTPLEGAIFEIYNEDGKPIEKIETGRNGLAVSNNLEYGIYYVKEVKAPVGYILGTDTYKLDVNEQGQIVKLNIKNNKVIGKIKIIKMDETGKIGLDGATFEIKNEAGEIVDTITTEKGGIAISKDLPYGNYFIKETKAPTGHLLSSATYTTAIKEDGKIVEVVADNKKVRGQVQISKISSDSKVLLEGATFEIYDKDGKSVERLTTDNDGRALSHNLEYGSYTVREVEAPLGYVLSDATYHFNIDSQDKIIKIEAKNDVIKGFLEILKVDSSNKKTLKGAEFEIYNEGGKRVDKLITDDKGRAVSVHLPYGKYTVKETKAPIGYLLPSKGYSFVIKQNGETIKLEAPNDIITGSVEFTKKDLTTDEPVPGAKIQITDKETKKIVYEGITDEEGNIHVKLPYGKYIIRETVAPEGYVLNESIGEFEIRKDGEIIKAELKNKRIVGRLDFVKVAEDEKTPLQGAKIQILDKDKKVIYEGITNKEGILMVNLPFGKYVIKEVEAPKGYALSSEPIEFEIKEDGQVVKAKMVNKKEPKKPEQDKPKDNPKDIPKDTPKDNPKDGSGSSSGSETKQGKSGKLPQTGSALGTSALIAIGIALTGLGGYIFKKKKGAK